MASQARTGGGVHFFRHDSSAFDGLQKPVDPLAPREYRGENFPAAARTDRFPTIQQLLFNTRPIYPRQSAHGGDLNFGRWKLVKHSPDGSREIVAGSIFQEAERSFDLVNIAGTASKDLNSV